MPRLTHGPLTAPGSIPCAKTNLVRSAIDGRPYADESHPAPRAVSVFVTVWTPNNAIEYGVNGWIARAAPPTLSTVCGPIEASLALTPSRGRGAADPSRAVTSSRLLTKTKDSKIPCGETKRCAWMTDAAPIRVATIGAGRTTCAPTMIVVDRSAVTLVLSCGALAPSAAVTASRDTGGYTPDIRVSSRRSRYPLSRQRRKTPQR